MSNTGFSAKDKFMTGNLMSITREYSRVKKLQRANNIVPQTFSRSSLPLQSTEIAGETIRFAHSPNEGKPAVILLSPFPTSIISYELVWSTLSQHFDLYAFDMPGFGGSSGGTKYMDFMTQGEFLHEFIEAMSISRPHIVGPDVGMPAALALAILYPGQAGSIIVGDGPGVEPSANGSIIKKMVESSFWRKVFASSGAGALVLGTVKLGYVNYSPSSFEINDYINSYLDRVPDTLQWFANYPTSLASFKGRLKSITTPTLVYWGESDVILLPENAKNLGAIIPNAQIEILSNAGHMTHQDQPEKFSQMIIDWVANLSHEEK